MDNCTTIDIEDALQAALNADGIAACAPPVPANLAEQVVVVATGGYSQAYVQDVHAVSFDCYASGETEAMSRACALTRWVRALPGKTVGTYCYGAEVETLPYNNPDPAHPTLARATFAARITTRVRH